MLRLNKILSNSGVCSRREADQLISAARVKVNDVVIQDLGTKINQHDKIAVDDKIIDTNLSTRLWVYYKPVGFITTTKDPQNRHTIFEQLKDLPRVISIGRLDLNSEGLLLLTNNGDLARKFELPSSKISRIYKVKAYGNYNNLLKFFQKHKNIKIDNIIYNVESIVLEPSMHGANQWFKISLLEGKNREIRKIFQFFNLQVNKLIRINYGPFALGKLKPGQYFEIKDLIKHKLIRG